MLVRYAGLAQCTARNAIAICIMMTVAVFPSVASPSQQQSVPIKPYIIGGSDVLPGEFPFMVSIQSPDLPGDPVSHYCGGTLISPSHVLTAAHCVQGLVEDEGEAADTVIVIGREDNRQVWRGQTRGIARWAEGGFAVAVHPKYDDKATQPNLQYDVAVLTLDQPVRGVPLMRLPSPGSDVLERPGSMLTVAGWGNTASNDRVFPDRMQKVSVPALAPFECRFAYGDSVSTDIHLCAGTGGRDSCQGDSGGPLFTALGNPSQRDFVQVGIVSWGQGCAVSGKPGVYARLSNPEINAFLRKYTGD